MHNEKLINFKNFIAATRDSGYKHTAAAMAELVDNAIEARATIINIEIETTDDLNGKSFEIRMRDNGVGMDSDELRLALQFGGSTRFNSRKQFGRYGMGLPNSSLSQCRRVEVVSWKSPGYLIFNYLDLDEILSQDSDLLPEIKTIPGCDVNSVSGTIVTWKKCDRLSYKYLKSILKHIQFEIGRIFRNAINDGVRITLCGTLIKPFDPLFLNQGLNLQGGLLYGTELHYKIKIPGKETEMSAVKVRFVELPVETWALFPNEDKRRYRITKNAGVSILRAGREIDFGWFFMGDKRKENYDDWWRCEISFDPELDEIFGVTHTKQEIKETEFLKQILTPDIEQISRSLNNRVRLKFVELKKKKPILYSKPQLERTDVYLPALKNKAADQVIVNHTNKIKSLSYEIRTEEFPGDEFYSIREQNGSVILGINTNHVFYNKVFKLLHEKKIDSVADFIKIIEMIIFSAARSEFAFVRRKGNKILQDFKLEWSSQLKTFIS